jgi:hypothetical protein
MASPPRILGKERQHVPRVFESRVFGVLHLYWGVLPLSFQNEVNLGAILRSEVEESAVTEIGDALPELDANPLLEERTSRGTHDVP